MTRDEKEQALQAAFAAEFGRKEPTLVALQDHLLAFRADARWLWLSERLTEEQRARVRGWLRQTDGIGSELTRMLVELNEARRGDK